MIPPGIADDAVKAVEILAGFTGVSLCEAARYYKKHHDIRSKAPTLETAWNSAIALRKNHRPTTRRDYRLWKKALPAEFLKTNVSFAWAIFQWGTPLKRFVQFVQICIDYAFSIQDDFN